MPLATPNLDDRRFADLVTEARNLIPRYAPEWTDHNASDPGITLLELFAWLTETTLFRLNQVPDLHYIKFLQLLGLELTPAQPARADLTFTLARTDREYVAIPAGTQIAAGTDAAGQPILFETLDPLIALGAKLAAVQSFDGFSYSTETAKNATTGQWFHPFGAHARPGSALLLGFDSPLPFTAQTVDLACYLPSTLTPPPPHACDLDLGTLPPPATLVWEYWDGRFWQSFTLTQDSTRAFSRSGHIVFRGPGTAAKKTKIGQVTQDLYWFRARLEQSRYEAAPRLDRILTNTTPALQAITQRDEVLGGSNGRPGQTFRLAHAPVVLRDRPEIVPGADGRRITLTSLRLEVAETTTAGFLPWQEVDDFLASKPDDPHYTLNRTTGEVRFGDGRHGRIPLINQDTPTVSIVARHYRYGGGPAGNVAAATITELQTTLDGIESVTNHRPATGGAAEEPLEDAKLRAATALKNKGRAVTVEDFESLALATPGTLVRRAKALPLHHPRYTGAPIPGVITVIVVPESDTPNPLPNETTLAAVCAHLNRARLLTSEVHVVPPLYHRITVEADVVVLPDADLGQVKQAVETRLVTYFHPLHGGEQGQGWEFGRTIFYSNVYRVILDTPGVDRILNNQLVLYLDDTRQEFCRDVPLDAGALLYSETHRISVGYA